MNCKTRTNKTNISNNLHYHIDEFAIMRRRNCTRRNNSNNSKSKKNEEMEYLFESSMANSAEETTSINGVPPIDIFTCCNLVFGACRTACENLNLAQRGTIDNSGKNFRTDLKKHCPSMQMDFWNCINKIFEAATHGPQWPGRRCCSLGLSPRCRNICAISSSSANLTNICRRSDEQRLYACFNRQEAGERCCNTARSLECLQVCNGLFEPQKPKKQNSLQSLSDKCGEHNADVLDCVRNSSDVLLTADAQKLLPCCEFSDSATCRSTCRAMFNVTFEQTMDIVVNELQQVGCGVQMPHLPLWQCFFTVERKAFVPMVVAATDNKAAEHHSQINEIGIDAAKLHCCEKALSQKCRRLCAQTYTKEWQTSIADFERDCRLQPEEQRLRQCLEDVDEPATLGCDGLNYCTNFNNRPTELFRSCSPEADAAARSDYKLWQQRGYVTLPGVDLATKNMSRCAPEKWKAVACALQIKPSTRIGHYSHICREDCYEILSECMDWTRMKLALSAAAICARFHPNEQGVELPCVSLRPYLEESDVPKDTGGHHGLTSLCKRHRCNASEVCVPRRRINAIQQSPYQCVPACSLGEGSNYWVPFGTFVRIPSMGDSIERNLLSYGTVNGFVGFKVCRCGAQGRIEYCQPLPSFSYEHCFGGYEHGKSFMVECNVCSCFAGETTCTKKQCRLPGFTDNAYTSLPCNCPTHYVPVCGINGNTYHSSCVAKCLGLQDSEIEYGACSISNPCQKGKHTCAPDQQCLVQRKVCLSTMQRPCPQYKCVNQTENCSRTIPLVGSGSQEANSVCDTSGRTHRSACDLLNARANLDYWGGCQLLCDRKSVPVCGINGVTYDHECAAWADYVLVDYSGRCRSVGLLANDLGRRCRAVTCTKLPSPYCPMVVPPGACCPICGGALRVIYSRKQIDRALYALPKQFNNLFTLQNVLAALDSLIDLKECQLTGVLSMEVGLFVAVVPRVKGTPSRIQIEACVREAERVSALIAAQSHQITTNLVLSGLTTSFIVNPSIESGVCAQCIPSLFTVGLLSVHVLWVTLFMRNGHSQL